VRRPVAERVVRWALRQVREPRSVRIDRVDVHVAGAVAVESDLAAVGGPMRVPVGRWRRRRQVHRWGLAAEPRDIDVPVAVAVARKGDVLAVWRPARAALLAGIAGDLLEPLQHRADEDVRAWVADR